MSVFFFFFFFGGGGGRDNVSACKEKKIVKECQKWKEHIENIKIAKFEAPGIKE